MSGIDWTGYHRAQRQRREQRVPVRVQAVLALRRQGYTVEAKSEVHFRINGILDVWVVHNRWHDLVTKERGGARELSVFVKGRVYPTEDRSRYADRVGVRLGRPSTNDATE